MTLIDFRYSREVGLFRDADDVRVINDPTSRRAAKKINEILPQLQYLIEDTQLDEAEAKKVRPPPHGTHSLVHVAAVALVTGHSC